MKNISCEICLYSKVYNEDKEYESILEMLKDAENNFLICTHNKVKKVISKNTIKDGGYVEKGIYPRVEDDFVCELFEKDKRMAKEIRILGGHIK